MRTFDDEISFSDDTSAPMAPITTAPIRVTTVKPATALVATATALTATTKPSQDVERVDAAGAARATADELLAKSMGFSPAPPVFEIGTVVNSTGVDNFRRSRQDWDKLPSLPELSKTFADRIRREQREDLLVAAPLLKAHVNGRLSHEGHTSTSDHWLMSERAMDGLAARVTPGGASYLKQCPMDLRATNLNHWLEKAQLVDARASKKAGKEITKPQDLTLRTRARKGGSREVFAVCGPKYAAFNVDKVVAEAAAGIGGDARGQVTYDGYRMTLDAVFHSNIAPENAVAGEFFKGCVRITAADDGTGAVKVKLGLWRNLCRNLIIVDFDTVLVGSRKHIGAATIEVDVRELMGQASERIALIVGKWSEASTENVLSRYDLTDVDEVFRGLVLNGQIKATGKKPDEMVKMLHEAWEREPGYSKTSILNAITRAAHEGTWQSWADSEELESQAGELLYQQVWQLDYSEKTAEEILA